MLFVVSKDQAKSVGVEEVDSSIQDLSAKVSNRLEIE